MRSSSFKPLAAAALIAALSIGAPAFAEENGVSAPAATTAGAPSQGNRAEKPSSAPLSIEARIASLHEKLHISADQEESWKAVADVMRSNEQTIHGLIVDRHAKAASLNAVEDLESYEGIANAHAEGLRNLIPVFKTLYDTMSDDQKKNADSVFDHYEGRRGRKARAAN
jgi:hypothetical protein